MRFRLFFYSSRLLDLELLMENAGVAGLLFHSFDFSFCQILSDFVRFRQTLKLVALLESEIRYQKKLTKSLNQDSHILRVYSVSFEF